MEVSEKIHYGAFLIKKYYELFSNSDHGPDLELRSIKSLDPNQNLVNSDPQHCNNFHHPIPLL
jgi:hypothetical protein